MSGLVVSIEKETIKISGTKICSNNKENKTLNHDLKIQEVFGLVKEVRAKGVRRINTFIIIYLTEYDIDKFSNPIETKLFINPSKENMLKPVSSTKIFELKFSTNVERQIFLFKIISPISRIERDIFEINLIKYSIIKSEELIVIAHNNNLKINWVGF